MQRLETSGGNKYKAFEAGIRLKRSTTEMETGVYGATYDTCYFYIIGNLSIS